MNPGTILPAASRAAMRWRPFPGFGLAGVATNTIPGAWGAEYAKVIEVYDHFAGMRLVGEDLPQANNGVTLHSTEKVFGQALNASAATRSVTTDVPAVTAM
jgi:hypothetical protein